jgi:hypothetical protein
MAQILPADVIVKFRSDDYIFIGNVLNAGNPFQRACEEYLRFPSNNGMACESERLSIVTVVAAIDIRLQMEGVGAHIGLRENSFLEELHGDDTLLQCPSPAALYERFGKFTGVVAIRIMRRHFLLIKGTETLMAIELDTFSQLACAWLGLSRVIKEEQIPLELRQCVGRMR